MKKDDKNFVFLGEIVNTQGRKGEVRLISYLSLSSFFTAGGKSLLESMKDVYLVNPDGERKEARILAMREQKGFIILKFSGYDTINQADQLKKYKVACRRVPLAKGAYYVRDLMGMEVFAKDKKGLRRLGKIVDIFGTGANDIYVIKEEGREILFPALKRLVKEIDINKKRMIIDLPQEL
ncbi:MAG: ribosome maturation factor RimM [bacterium]